MREGQRRHAGRFQAEGAVHFAVAFAFAPAVSMKRLQQTTKSDTDERQVAKGKFLSAIVVVVAADAVVAVDDGL